MTTGPPRRLKRNKKRIMASLEESKLTKLFQKKLVSSIKRFPNDKASLQALEAKSLVELIITYIGWRTFGERSRYPFRYPFFCGSSANIPVNQLLEKGGALIPSPAPLPLRRSK